MKKDLSADDIGRIFANPFYCLSDIDVTLCAPHEPLVTEEVWVRVGAKLIQEIGAEKYLQHLLENLKGNYVSAPITN